MLYKFLADIVLILHLFFILFVLFGAILAFKFPKIVWFHLPIATYGALITFYRWICPLTPLENYFRALAGEQGYEGGFIAHYILPVIYPSGVTTGLTITMGLTVIIWNGIIYGLLIYRNKKQ